MLKSRVFVQSVSVGARDPGGAVTSYSVTLQSTDGAGFLPENHSFALTTATIAGLGVGTELEVQIGPPAQA